jgi:hypothetical protein
MISIEKLKQFGFIDVSSDKNGMAFRKELPGRLLEICYYIQEKLIRLQTIRSGFTYPLTGIENENDLKSLWLLITGHDLI